MSNLCEVFKADSLEQLKTDINDFLNKNRVLVKLISHYYENNVHIVYLIYTTEKIVLKNFCEIFKSDNVKQLEVNVNKFLNENNILLRGISQSYGECNSVVLVYSA